MTTPVVGPGGGAEVHVYRCGKVVFRSEEVNFISILCHGSEIQAPMATTGGLTDDVTLFVMKRGNEGTKKKAFTLFDHVPDDVTNLQVGAPGDTQLKKAAEILKEAAVHRMVCFS